MGTLTIRNQTNPAATPRSASTAQPGHPAAVKFSASEGFLAEVKRRVDEYFRTTGRSPRDCPAMYLKTAVVLTCFGASYVLLVFVASAWWMTVPLAIVLGLATAGVGLTIQHDAAHRAYSNRAWVNKAMSLTLDLVGGSSYIWDWKHNSMHHTYTNIAGEDNDIDVGFLGRLSPQQKHLWFHRFQHIYMWFLYGLLTIKWQLIDDLHYAIAGRIGQRRIPRPRGMDLFIFIAGKAVFVLLALLLPALLHPFWVVLAVYGLASFICGVTLGVVFQLAHCVEAAEFPVPGDSGKMANEWAVHQVETTADFARDSRLISWLVGGLNFQVEHHLLTRICHIHYPAISKLVEQVCAEYGLQHNAHRSFLAAVASHYRWLKQMGLQPSEA